MGVGDGPGYLREESATLRLHRLPRPSSIHHSLCALPFGRGWWTARMGWRGFSSKAHAPVMAAVLTVLSPIGDLSGAGAVRRDASLDMRQSRPSSDGSWHFLHMRAVGSTGSEAGTGEREGGSGRGWGGRGSHRGRLVDGGRVGFRALEHIRQGRARLVARGGRWEDGWPCTQKTKGQRISISGCGLWAVRQWCRQHGLLTR